MSTGDLANPQLQDALQRAKEVRCDANPAKRAVMDGGTPIATVGTVPSLGGMNLVQGGFGGGSSDPISEILQVPDNCVGLIIGRKGEQITAIQAQTGCKVQMAQDSESNGQTRQCTLTGDPGAIGRAKARINEIIEKGANRPPPGQGGGGGGRMGGGGGMMNGGGGQQNNGIPAPGPGEITVDIPVPGNKCGLVIGKAGDTIKQLQERSGCHMKLIQDNTLASNAPKPLRVTGTPQKIEHVKQMVDEIISKNMDSDGPRHGGGGGGHMGGGGGGYQNRGPPGGHNMNQGGGQFGGGGQRNVGEVIVPRSSVGMIIGKGGDMIKKLAADTGARIQFKNDEAQDAPERTAVLTGTVDQIQRATQLITDLVHRSMSDGQQETFYMHVPANKTGLVIGKGGETIKQINNESGAHVELNRETQNNPNEKVFIIKGTPYQIHVAKHLICIKVGDIPVGTPVGPFTGGGVTVNTTPAQPQHGAPHHQAPMQQFPGQQYPGAPMQGYSQPQPMPPQQWQPQQQPHYGAPQPMPVPMQPVQSVPQPAPMADWQQQQPAQQPYQQPTTTAQPQMQAYQPQQPQQPQPAYGSTVYAPAVSAAPQQPQAQAAVQTSTASTAAPAINPQTGQPDYSAQWAEYYRSQGMHEQAALIEAQARQSQQTQQPAAARPVQQAQPQVSAYQPQYATGAPAQTTTSMAPTQPASSYPGAAPAAQPAPYGAPQQQYQPQAQAQPQYAYQPQQQQPHHY